MQSAVRSAAYYQTADGRDRKRALNARRPPHSARAEVLRGSAAGLAPDLAGPPPAKAALGRPSGPSQVRVDVRPMPVTHAVVPWANPALARAAGPWTAESARPMQMNAAASAAPTPKMPRSTPAEPATPIPMSGWLIVTPLILDYLCETLGRVERRPVGAAEVLNLLKRLVRQRCLGRRVKSCQDAPPHCTGPP